MRLRRLALFAMTLALVGCTRYTTTRAQGPFGRKPAASPPGGYAGAPLAPRSPLAIAGTPDPVPPGPPGDNPAVPPRPPAGNLVSNTNPTPSEIIQAGGIAPYTPDPLDPNEIPPRRRRTVPNDPLLIPTRPIAPPVPNTPPNTSPAPADENLAQLKRLQKLALDKWATMDSFESRMVRREMIGKEMTPTDEVLFQFRKQPFSVFMKYVGEAGKGREVLYVMGQYDDKMQILTGAGDPLRGIKVKRSPDDPDVTKRSRHNIREAGFDKTLGIMSKQLEQLESGKLPPGSVRYVGPTKRPEHGDRPLEMVVRTVGPKEDPTLEGGGAWTLWFDAQPNSDSYGLPVVLILQDARGTEIEYICYTNFRGPLHLADADFALEKLGKKK